MTVEKGRGSQVLDAAQGKFSDNGVENRLSLARPVVLSVA
jgi:hypothetical protein